MKINDIKKLLKANKSINDYVIEYSKKESSELFFVLKNLEINRATSTEDLAIRVYVDVKYKRGSSVVTVTSADDEKTLSKKINDAIKKAKNALNPYYPVASKQTSINNKVSLKESLNSIALKTADAILKADKYKDGWINSTEIFVSKNTYEFYNSKGVHHHDEKLKVEFEIIPTWSNKKEEYELYDYFKSNKLDAKVITNEVNEKLNLAKLRSEAKTLKDVKLPKDLPVLIYGEMNDLIVDNIKNDLSYGTLYAHSNHYNVKDVLSNNKMNFTLKANIPGVVNSRSYDSSGLVLSSKAIIKDGKVVSTHGDLRNGYYLKVNKPSGQYSACLISGDTLAYNKKPHIIIDHFSSPQLESSSGYFGGEVRLARYFDGKKYIPLTSFTISGNLYEGLKDIKFSKEETTTSSYKGPKYFIFNNMHIQ